MRYKYPRTEIAVSQWIDGISSFFQREVSARRSLCHLSVSVEKQYRRCGQQRSTCQS
ncbi:unnamed protein product [Acanthoscelides obtectus]|uniref:Uncharacterized protein n=1 Tax=Acanthoscelides obtectus TaxID=200917 RepID=A0A9P0K3N1_ACAOB|nr:unnamed protein product [Acanthoscelides obtectus]CAK1657057.1 hypothetical protein AOBTE_LOCUS20092 [Acanthoscelides obtectus]